MNELEQSGEDSVQYLRGDTLEIVENSPLRMNETGRSEETRCVFSCGPADEGDT